MGQRALSVKLLGRHGGRDDQLDPAVVQHVHQPGEAPRGRRHVDRHIGHIGQQHGMELACDLQVVVLRARAAAQLAEVEPDHATGAAARTDLARLDVQHRVLVLDLGQLVEGLGHGRIGLGTQRRVVEPGVFQRAAAVVRAVVHVDDFHALVEQVDGRQDAVAVQAARVQLVGLEVGGGDKAHAVGEQRHQQPVQDHRVRDVGHVEFIEADQLVLLGDARTQHVQRVLGALQHGEFTVDLAHEFMEMQAHLAPERHGVEEAIHEKALAAPHPAVHVDATGDLGMVDELLEGVGAALAVDRPVVGTALQRLDGAQLRRITVKALGYQFGLVGLSH